MKEAAFLLTLNEDTPVGITSIYLQAMWYDAKGDWEKAHTLIQDLQDKQAAWIHAYLHRKEGDQFNAGYWYKRAGKTPSTLSLKDEWKELVNAFL